MSVITHGCRSNLAEHDALAAMAGAGLTVINSCAVTARAVRDARSAARVASRNGPVVVTGCAATVAPERFTDIARVLPNAAKFDVASWGALAVPLAVTRQSRAFLSIQDGCDHDCTFCVTRLARGPSRSVAPDSLIDQLHVLADEGFAEVVLTGIDASSYGRDLSGSPTLGALLQAMLRAIPSSMRLRLSSLDAARVDAALVEAFAEPGLAPHAHLSLQSGDDLILKRMKRRHSRADAMHLVERLKAVRPDIAIGADLIAGFPTESDAAHQATRTLLDDCDIVHAHVFPFSPRPGTAAAKMPALEHSLARSRAATLRIDANERNYKYSFRMLNKILHTISEGNSGISEHGLKVRYARPRPRGSRVLVRVTRFEQGQLAE